MRVGLKIKSVLAESRSLAVAVMGLTLAIFGATIYFGTAHLGRQIRDQIVSRDAEILHAVALMQQINNASQQELGGEIENLTDQVAIALQISELKGVIAVRLFDARGGFAAAFPAQVAPASLSPEDLARLSQLNPLSHFQPRVRLASLFEPGATVVRDSGDTAPLLEVALPLHRKNSVALLGVMQFVMDGQSIASQFAVLNRNLVMQGSLVFLAGGALLLGALGWAFRRLQATHRQLVERTTGLLRANEALALAAKTSAVGSVTAHLIHGLSNPLAGLQTFVQGRNRDQPHESHADWQSALATTQRMQGLIAEIVRILSEANSSGRYELTLAELVESALKKMQPVADQAWVQLRVELRLEGALSNCEANLVLLILENLLQNAIDATPVGKVVCLKVYLADDVVCYEVQDEGAGIPEEMKSTLFTPRPSAKPKGSGIGLAICKQLANHLDAGLGFQSKATLGSVFVLSLPRAKMSHIGNVIAC
jgi:signal transduction histidine kinase